MTDDYAKKYDEWILKAATLTDQEERRKVYEQIQLAAQEEAVVIWMYQRINMIPVQSWIKGLYYNPACTPALYLYKRLIPVLFI